MCIRCCKSTQLKRVNKNNTNWFISFQNQFFISLKEMFLLFYYVPILSSFLICPHVIFCVKSMHCTYSYHYPSVVLSWLWITVSISTDYNKKGINLSSISYSSSPHLLLIICYIWPHKVQCWHCSVVCKNGES